MSSLSAFLADIEDDEDVVKVDKEEDDEGEEDNNPVEQMEIDVSALKVKDVKQLAKFLTEERTQRIMGRVEHCLQVPPEKIVGRVEDQPEYKLLVESNDLSRDINDEVEIIHRFLRDVYSKKFPELESLIPHPIDYARTVAAIKNEMDITLVNLDMLPAAVKMVVTVSGTTTTGKPLDDEDIAKAMDAAQLMVQLDDYNKLINQFVESRTTTIAPNLSNVVGSAIAAKIITAAGGLTALSQLPSSRVQTLGSRKKSLHGLSSGVTQYAGHLFYSDIVLNTPASFKVKAVRLVAGKCTLCGRIDAFHEHADGSEGIRFREEILAKIDKWQEAAPLKAEKPLPAPDDQPRKKRGGKRARKIKEKFAMTDFRKEANRLKFGDEDQEGFFEGDIAAAKTRFVMPVASITQGAAKKFKANSGKSFGSSGVATSGMASSVAFTPVQGLELQNPMQKVREANEKYFGAQGSFLKVGDKRKRTDE